MEAERRRSSSCCWVYMLAHDGTVLRDGAAVLTETRDDYRQLFTTIFSDYYLFEDLDRGEGVGS